MIVTTWQKFLRHNLQLWHFECVVGNKCTRRLLIMVICAEGTSFLFRGTHLFIYSSKAGATERMQFVARWPFATHLLHGYVHNFFTSLYSSFSLRLRHLTHSSPVGSLVCVPFTDEYHRIFRAIMTHIHFFQFEMNSSSLPCVVRDVLQRRNPSCWALIMFDRMSMTFSVYSTVSSSYFHFPAPVTSPSQSHTRIMYFHIDIICVQTSWSRVYSSELYKLLVRKVTSRKSRLRSSQHPGRVCWHFTSLLRHPFAISHVLLPIFFLSSIHQRRLHCRALKLNYF